jgi:DNA-binding PadR family transcriptional regulator
MSDRQPTRALTPLSLAILIVVAEAPLHGYAILTALESKRGPRLVAGAGSLYAALDRMTDDGLLAMEPDADDSRRKWRFAITPLGRRVARAELRRMEAVVSEGRAHRLLPEAT